MANSTEAYRGNVVLEFDDNGSRTRIRNEQIIYIMINESYQNISILPIIYVSISVNSSLFNNIINKKETGKFYLSLAATDVFSFNSVSTESISGLFRYLPETTNTDYAAELNYAENDLQDTSYRTITIGLVSEEQTNLLRKPFNSISRNVDTNTLIITAMENLKNVIIEPIENNVKYEQILIPPVTSVYKFLEQLFARDAFYNTNFRFFMGFSKTYLLSQKGKAFTPTNNSVIFNVKDVTSKESLLDGIEMRNGAYYVYVSGINSNYSTDQAQQHIVNNVVSYNDNSGVVSNMKINNNGSGRDYFVRSNYGNTVKNEIDSDGFTVTISKQNVDSSIFTPEKEYSISGDGENSKYNGTYLLINKDVLYKSVDGNYNITCILTLKPTSDNETAHTTTNTAGRTSLATSQSATRTTSATAATSSASTMSRSQQLSQQAKNNNTKNAVSTNTRK